MEIFERLRIFRSRWVIPVLILGLAFGIVGYLIREIQLPVYQASVRLLVGSFIEAERPQSDDVQVANDLTKTYAQLLMTSPVRQAAIQAFDLRNVDGTPLTLEQLRDSVRITAGVDIPFIDILAFAASPELAAKKADALAQQILQESPSTSSAEEQGRQASILAQIKYLTGLRNTNQALLENLDDPSQPPDRLDIPMNHDDQRQALTNTIIRLSDAIADLEETLSTLQARTNTVRIVEPARVPVDTVGGSKWLVFGLGFIVGSMLGSGLLMVFDDLFPRLNSLQRVKRLNGLPVLGNIPRMRLARKPSADWLVLHHQPLSASAEAYRRLYTQLYHGQTQDTAPVYIVNSPHASEGKSVTAANFAVMLASAGYKVLIVDANLRHPVMHNIFEIDETAGGLARLLDASPRDLDALTADELNVFFKTYIRESAVPNVYVLPRGKVEDDQKIASLMLHLPQLQNWLDPLHTRLGIDVFVFDTGAYTTSSEALLLADALEGQTVLILETRGTSCQQAQEMINQFHRTRTHLVGAVLNKQSKWL